MTDDLIKRLRDRAKDLRDYITSSEVVINLLSSEVEKFENRNAPWDTYTVGLAVDHKSSVRTQTKEAEEYEQAADTLEAQAAEIARLRDIPNHIWAEARDSEWDEGFNYAVKLFRAALEAKP